MLDLTSAAEVVEGVMLGVLITLENGVCVSAADVVLGGKVVVVRRDLLVEVLEVLSCGLSSVQVVVIDAVFKVDLVMLTLASPLPSPPPPTYEVPAVTPLTSPTPVQNPPSATNGPYAIGAAVLANFAHPSTA